MAIRSDKREKEEKKKQKEVLKNQKRKIHAEKKLTSKEKKKDSSKISSSKHGFFSKKDTSKIESQNRIVITKKNLIPPEKKQGFKLFSKNTEKTKKSKDTKEKPIPKKETKSMEDEEKTSIKEQNKKAGFFSVNNKEKRKPMLSIKLKKKKEIQSSENVVKSDKPREKLEPEIQKLENKKEPVVEKSSGGLLNKIEQTSQDADLTLKETEKILIPKEKKQKAGFFSSKGREEKKQVSPPSKSKKPLFTKKKKEKQKSVAHKDGVVETVSKVPFKLSDEQLDMLKKEVWNKENLDDFEQWEEIEWYPLQEPFAYTSILQHMESLEKRYFVVEINLDETEKKQLKFLVETNEIMPADIAQIEEEGIEKALDHQIEGIIADYSLKMSSQSKEKLMYYIKRDCLGLGILEPLMKDGHIEDISCDGAELPLFIYHRIHGSIQSNVLFSDEEVLSSFVSKLAQRCGKHISIAHPMLDATMPDGSRIQMTLSSEVSTKGSTFTIRKFKEQPFSPSDLIHFNTMSDEMMSYLWIAVQHGSSALISGGTASGKTSVLNAISLFIPRESKIVSIEETREINLPHPNWIPGVVRSGFGDVVDGKLTGEIDLFDLMKAALRQRPEYIIVGEIRGREAYVLFQAMATGHTTYSTVHADSAKSLIHRLEGEPINIPRIMLQSLDIVCIETITRVKNKRVRRCKQIIEIIDIDPTSKEILTNEVFHWDPIKDTHIYSGKSYILENIRLKLNMKHEEIIDELHQRAKLLQWMVGQNIYEFEDVASVSANYLENPKEIIEKIG